MKTYSLPATDVLHDLFEYSPETGELRWRFREGPPRKVGAHNKRFAGKIAGNIVARANTNYVTVQIGSSPRYAHRVIFKMMTGTDPLIVDHINGNGLDNRWSNLRHATPKQSVGNTKPRKRSGLKKGVRKKGKRYYAYMTQNRRFVHLGSFDTEAKAHAAYCAAANAYFGRFSNPG